MKTYNSFLIAILLTFASAMFAMTAIASPDDKPAGITVEQFDLMPLAFTANHGQWDDRVQFKANAGGAAMWFTTDGVYYQFTRQTPVGQEPCAPDDPRERQMSTSAEQLVIKASFLGANPNPEIVGENMMEYKCNYFIGNDPDEWHTDVPNYKSVILKDIYAGIDLKYFGNGKQMEYDFIVSPGADPNQIMVQYDGSKSISVNDDGELVVETEWGDVTELRPLVYQFDANGCMPIDGRYVLYTDNTFGFDLGDRYDPTLALVIDPVLSYSTYLGGENSDNSNNIAVDNAGAAYIIGKTYSDYFPIHNAYQVGPMSSIDAFVTKLSSAGNGLIYSTYLGGSFLDEAFGIVVDSSGAYVTGVTMSDDFPTWNPYQTYQDYGDVFITKLTSAGNLVYSTCLGGMFGQETAYDIAVDGSGAVYVTGKTTSLDFPTYNAYQDEPLGGYISAFVTKLSYSGSSLIYSTFLSGSDGVTKGKAIAVDDSGSAYVTGYTEASDYPTVNFYQDTNEGGGDVFVTKLSYSGSSLIYSTYLGGSDSDIGNDIAVDSFGHAYVIGSTASSDFPILAPYMTDQLGEDAFVTKFTSSGDNLLYSTYLGGSDIDDAQGISVDNSGAAYITGYTYSTDFPTWPDQTDPDTTEDGIDVFVTKLSSTGSTLRYSTYLGGSSFDYGYGIAVDDSWSTYVTGETGSTDFPIQNQYQTDQGSIDAFVTKFGICVPGDADGSGAVDIDDVVYLINYIFGGGPPPVSADCCGDADGSDNVDIDDVAYLNNYIFGGGPAPDPDACNPPW